MRRLLVVFAVCASAVVWASAPASAKGAVDGAVRGPNVAGDGVAELDQDQTNELAMATSLYTGISRGGGATSRVVERTPMGTLGPRYVVTYNFLTGERGETSPVRQRLYPLAAGGPIAFTPPGQNLCDRCGRGRGGWFDVRYEALAVLADVGIPVPRAVLPSTWTIASDDAHGVSISYPPSWHAAPSTLTPVLADPIVPLAVGTAAMVPQQLGECDIVPQHAVEAVGRTDALVLVYLYQGMASWSSDLARPQSFGPELPWRTGPVQCTDGNSDVTVRTLSFADGRARISVIVVVGKDATPQRNAEVYAVLDSLRVS